MSHLDFDDEAFFPCESGLVAGTFLCTESGQSCVEKIEAGARVLTRDSGFRAIVSVEVLSTPYKVVALPEGALGCRMPAASLAIAADQLLLVTAYPGLTTTEALIRAESLIGLPGIVPAISHAKRYRLDFGRPEIVLANGAWLAVGALEHEAFGGRPTVRAVLGGAQHGAVAAR